jgi:hypothetical protein
MMGSRALVTKATAATSWGFSKRFRSELGRAFSKNSFFTAEALRHRA